MPLLRLGPKLLHFIHIPRTGGHAIAFFAKSIGRIGHFSEKAGGAPCSAEHFHAALYNGLHFRQLVDWSFAVTRDPLDRLISEYKMLRDARQHGAATGKAAQSAFRARHMTDFDSWTKHVLSRYARDPFVCDNHIRPQVEFLTADARRFRFEKGLDQVAARLAFSADIDTPPAVLHTNKSTAGPVAASRETVRRIVEFYDRDYQELQYPYPADAALEGPALTPLKPPSFWDALKRRDETPA